MGTYTELYVQPAGSDVNGGSDDGASPKETYAGVTSDDSLGGSEVILEVASGGWGTTAVDDMVVWDPGTLVQFAKVLEINYTADSDKIRVDSVSGAISNDTKSVNVGGAFATIGFALDIIDTTWFNVAQDTLRVNIDRNGGVAYDEEEIIVTNAFTSAIPLVVEGYNTTPGDIDYTTSWDRVLIEPTSPSGTRTLYANSEYVHYRNIQAEITGANKFGIEFASSGSYSSLINCGGFSTNSHGIVASRNSTEVLLYRVSSIGNGGDGLESRMGAGSHYLGCVFANNGGNGCFMPQVGTIQNCLIYGNVVGINTSGNVPAVSMCNNIIADNSSHGINLVGAVIRGMSIFNNIIADNGGYGIESTLTGKPRFLLYDYNAFNNNTSGDLNETNINVDPRDNINGTQPWTETTAATRTSTGDYGITAAMKAAAFPGILAADLVTDTGYADMGALQHQAAGGGGGILTHPGMTGGARG